MTKKILIEGMSCQHCVNHVKNALEELEGIKSAKVSLENKSAEIELNHDVDDEKIKAAIDEVGYEVKSIQ
ncbi:MAG: heavy-metal-associated domain-containing protein [Acetivibrionales bacterium]|jgi:copper chaperone|nr:heavy-metal-associated domain-containing protein [Clostridiaceae bacterium]